MKSANKRQTCKVASGFRKSLRQWAQIWDTAALANDTLIEWSPRLVRSLGRAYPQQMLIRLSSWLRAPKHATILAEVLCHEAAHLAVYIRHGRDARMHGVEWRRFVEQAGYTPRTGIYIPELVCRGTSPLRYEHICPVCQAKRFAKRRQPSWRCIPCRQFGLDGKLIIHPVNATGEAQDE